MGAEGHPRVRSTMEEGGGLQAQTQRARSAHITFLIAAAVLFYSAAGALNFVFLFRLGAALGDQVRADALDTSNLAWAGLFVPLWIKDGLYALDHLRGLAQSSVSRRINSWEGLIDAALYAILKVLALRRLTAGSGSVAVVCTPLLLSVIKAMFFDMARRWWGIPRSEVGNYRFGDMLQAMFIASKVDGGLFASVSWWWTLTPFWFGIIITAVTMVFIPFTLTPLLLVNAHVRNSAFVVLCVAVVTAIYICMVVFGVRSALLAASWFHGAWRPL